MPVDAPLRITSDYGERNTGIANASSFHRGVDLGRDKSKKQTNLLSVAPSIIEYSGWNKYRGWYVVLQCDGFQVLYQHMKEKCKYAVGTKIETGQIIGIMGNSSDKSVLTVSEHLHFGVCYDFSKSTEATKGYVDPEPYLKNIQMEVEDMTEAEVKELLAGSQSTPSTWAKDGIKWAVDNKIIADDNNLDHRITKEEMAVMLYRLSLLK